MTQPGPALTAVVYTRVGQDVADAIAEIVRQTGLTRSAVIDELLASRLGIERTTRKTTVAAALEARAAGGQAA